MGIKKERVNSLAGSKEEFKKYVDAFYWKNPFRYRSFFLHKKVLEKIRRAKHEELFSDRDFLELVYETVSEWMGKRGKKKKLVSIANFREKIKEKSSILQGYVSFKLNELDNKKWEKIRYELKNLYVSLKIMDQKTQLVGVSKTLHHLLPDLVPPMDRAHTLRFFYGTEKSTPIIPQNREADKFLEILDKFRHICKKLDLTGGDLEREWDTSIPKLIDNAIVGYVESKLKKRNPA